MVANDYIIRFCVSLAPNFEGHYLTVSNVNFPMIDRAGGSFLVRKGSVR